MLGVVLVKVLFSSQLTTTPNCASYLSHVNLHSSKRIALTFFRL
jgi:hypothetical protein